MNCCLRTYITLLIGLSATTAIAEESADDVAKDLSNPANARASMSSNLEYISFDGDLNGADDQSSTVYLFQPTLPFPVGDAGKNILFRPVLPVFLSQAQFDPTENAGLGGFDDVTGKLGDIGFDLVYAGTSDTGVISGWGIAGTLPVGADEVTGDQWRVGPEVFFGIARKWGVVGALVSHQWDVGGSNNADFSTTTAQYFYGISMGGGWIFGAGPVASYNHETDSDDALTFPIAIGLSRTIVKGSSINKFAVALTYNAERPETLGPEWTVKLTWSPVIDNPLLRQ
jgi:hypothetical protein